MMKITTFNPQIVTSDAESVIRFFEELGFERRHTKTNIDDNDVTNVRMRYTNEDGSVFHVDVVQADVSRDITGIRMNVRDFDEAYHLLEANGFQNAQGKRVSNTPTSVATMMFAPSGFTINIAEHIRKKDE